MITISGAVVEFKLQKRADELYDLVLSVHQNKDAAAYITITLDKIVSGDLYKLKEEASKVYQDYKVMFPSNTTVN